MAYVDQTRADLFSRLPEELMAGVLNLLPPDDARNFAATNKRNNLLTRKHYRMPVFTDTADANKVQTVWNRIVLYTRISVKSAEELSKFADKHPKVGIRVHVEKTVHPRDLLPILKEVERLGDRVKVFKYFWDYLLSDDFDGFFEQDIIHVIDCKHLQHVKEIDIEGRSMVLAQQAFLSRAEKCRFHGIELEDNDMAGLLDVKELSLRRTNTIHWRTLKNAVRLFILEEPHGVDGLELFKSVPELTLMSLDRLKVLPALQPRKLNLIGCANLSDISALDASNLESVHIWNAEVRNVSVLENVPDVSLTECDLLTDVSALHRAVRLDLEHCHNVSNVNPLSSVEDLSLAFTAVEDVDNLTSVIRLNLQHTGVQDVSALKKCERLNIRGTGVTDVSMLPNLIDLTADSPERIKLPSNPMLAVYTR